MCLYPLGRHRRTANRLDIRTVSRLSRSWSRRRIGLPVCRRLCLAGAARVVIAGMLLALFGGGGLIPLSVVGSEPNGEGGGAEVEPVGDEAEAFAAMAAMRLPEGWQRSLFAAEPLVSNIVAFDVDPQGNLFVTETFRQNRGVTDNRNHDETWLLADLAAETVQDRIDYHKRLLGDAVQEYTVHDDRIRRVRDTNGDGRGDESVVFAAGFNKLEEGTGAGVLVRGNEVFYTCIPKLWKLIDSSGDGVADRRQTLSDGYGVRVAFRGHDLHGLILGPDGRLYFSIGDRGHNVTTADGQILANPASGSVFRCELDGTGLEVFATGLRNPQELAFNDVGDLFTGDNNSDSGDRSRLVLLVKGGDSGWRMPYQYLSDRGPFNREQIWHPRGGDLPTDKQPAYIIPPIANLGDGPSGFAFDPGTGVDASLRGRFLMCDFRGGAANSGIRSFRLEPSGASYSLADDDQPVWGVLATDVAFGPDGALWVSDWVEGWDGVGKGRIYRLTGPDFDSDRAGEVAAILTSSWDRVESPRLTEWLAHPDRRVRNESHWELARRGDVAALLAVLSDDEASAMARWHSLWGLAIVLRRGPAAHSLPADVAAMITERLVESLRDSDPILRAAAAEVLGEQRVEAAVPELIRLLRDDTARVRARAAIALASIPLTAHDEVVFDSVVTMLAETGDDDPVVRHAGVMALAVPRRATSVAALKGHPSQAVRLAAVVALRRLKSIGLVGFLSDPEAAVVLEAARAIHDLPIAGGLESLARLIRSGSTDDAFLRRVLNANYRLGTAESAAALAQFAARPIGPLSMRIEAIEMLREWGRPDPRDRVLNAFRPLPERPAAVAKSALAKALPMILKNADEIRERAIAVAAEYGIEEVTPVLIDRVSDEQLAAPLRASALRSLASIAPNRAIEPATRMVKSPEVSLRIAALDTLVAVEPTKAFAFVRQATQSKETAERQIAWDLVATIGSQPATDLIASGVREYLSGKLPADTTLNLLEAAAGRLDRDLANRLSQHQGRLESEHRLGRWWAALEGGDPRVGQQIYGRTQLSCVRCHRIGDQGGEVGPDLSAVGATRDREYLLESICLPDAAIAKGFETVVIADDLGQAFTGIIRHEDESTVELIQPDGKIERIDRDTIVARKRGKSAMPADLVDLMTLRELRDLVAYLVSLRAVSTP